jgi:hypothetical protein
MPAKSVVSIGGQRSAPTIISAVPVNLLEDLLTEHDAGKEGWDTLRPSCTRSS